MHWVRKRHWRLFKGGFYSRNYVTHRQPTKSSSLLWFITCTTAANYFFYSGTGYVEMNTFKCLQIGIAKFIYRVWNESVTPKIQVLLKNKCPPSNTSLTRGVNSNKFPSQCTVRVITTPNVISLKTQAYAVLLKIHTYTPIMPDRCIGDNVYLHVVILEHYKYATFSNKSYLGI